MDYLSFLFLLYSGRIGRATYWVGNIMLYVALIVASLGVGLLLRAIAGPHPSAAMGVVFTFFVAVGCGFYSWAYYALAAKRWHDRGKSGWWSLIVFVPFIGAIWALIELGFLAGDEDVNAYGEP